MFNRYAYVGNDPVNGWDPDGEEGVGFRQDEAVRAWSKGKISDEQLTTAMTTCGGDFECAKFQASLAAGALSIYVPGGASKTSLAVRGFFLRQGARKSFSGAFKFINKTIGKLEKTSGRSGRTTYQTFGKGGQKGANKLFNTLTEGKSKALESGGRIGKLENGARVQISSKNGVTSVRITQKTAQTGTRIKKTETIKVRFNDE